MREYFSDVWNIMDLTCNSTFIIGMVLVCAFGAMSIEAEQSGRIILALSLVLFYLRLYEMFEVSRLLGPKINMIGRMFMDIGIIAVLLLVCVVAFGVAFHALLQPKDFSRVVERPYWAMFGELFMDEAKELQESHCLESKRKMASESPTESSTTSFIQRTAQNITEMLTESVAESDCRTSPPILVAQILQALFVILTNLLLFNVLIAMFK